ncbi:MAG: hypothetical protein WBM83_01350 [Flavobacteriaceae bacterium]
MKRVIMTLLLVSGLFFSCSKDKADDQQDQNKIVGSWQATELQAADPNSSEVNLGAEILARLTAENCELLVFTFQEDLVLKVESGVNSLEINATATGLEVPCPTQKEIETTTYTYDGTNLTYVDTGVGTKTVKATIDGNILTIDATELDIPNLNGAGKLIFTKK